MNANDKRNVNMSSIGCRNYECVLFRNALFGQVHGTDTKAAIVRAT